MGKISRCLKYLFIIFHVLYAILGCVLIIRMAMAIANGAAGSGYPGMHWVWLLPISIFVIAGLGIYAAASENRIALKVFAGFMVVEVFTMQIGCILVVEATKQICEDFSFYKDVFFTCGIFKGFFFGLPLKAVTCLLVSQLMIHQAGR